MNDLTSMRQRGLFFFFFFQTDIPNLTYRRITLAKEHKTTIATKGKIRMILIQFHCYTHRNWHANINEGVDMG